MALKASENDWAVEELIIRRQWIGADTLESQVIHISNKTGKWSEKMASQTSILPIEKPYDKTKSSMWPHICVGLASNWVKTPQDLEKL